MIAKLLKRNETYLFFVILAFSFVVTMINPSFLTVENMFDLIKSSSGMAILAIAFFVGLLSGRDRYFLSGHCDHGAVYRRQCAHCLGCGQSAFGLRHFLRRGNGVGGDQRFFHQHVSDASPDRDSGDVEYLSRSPCWYLSAREPSIPAKLPDCFKVFGKLSIFELSRADGTMYGLSIFALLLLAVVVLTWFILQHTLLGKSIYAIGGSYEASKRAGFNIKGTLFFIYSYIGFPFRDHGGDAPVADPVFQSELYRRHRAVEGHRGCRNRGDQDHGRKRHAWRARCWASS